MLFWFGLRRIVLCMSWRLHGSTRTDTLFPFTSLFASLGMDVDRDAAAVVADGDRAVAVQHHRHGIAVAGQRLVDGVVHHLVDHVVQAGPVRSEKHTSELQSLMRLSYAVFCLTKKKYKISIHLERTYRDKHTAL